MLKLASVIYTVASASIMGALIVAALVSGFDTLPYVAGAAVIGALLALPVSYFVAKAIIGMEG